PSPTPAASPTAGLGLGMRAPTLTLPALGGGTIDTAAYAGTPLWVTFMATWCPSCIDELPMMDGLQARLGDDLAIVLVDVREDEELVASFINSLDVELPVALDRDGAVQAEWGYVLPTHYFIDADGILREVIFGGAPPPVFLDAVRLVAPEADLPVETLEPAGG
ncbi:MAG TPA: TlpA disulfide reductase family protein, partial [Candidatus Limnocylindria bacterium]|nr:TlpA disulfide reductase family protein [Candidatus Limnocylindria bacterium]